MGCNCKKKKIDNLETTSYTFDELRNAVNLLNSKIYFNQEDMDTLYDLHNRVFPLNKQYNRDCSPCFTIVKNNLETKYKSMIDGGK